VGDREQLLPGTAGVSAPVQQADGDADSGADAE